ncbi:MAG: selenium metabolism-associated LysR family transcriptional regulator [Candidatus Methylomirabilaceae bacterium]
MDLQQLKGFMAVAKHNSFSRASEELYRTQPAISKQIRALEESLETKLFHRLGRRIQLTDAGEILYRHAHRIFQVLEEARETISELKGLQTGHLRISAASTIGTYMLPRALGRFKRRYPGIEISLAITNKAQVLAQVLGHEADLGFVGPPVQPEELQGEEYLLDELVLIVDPNHPLAHEEFVSIDQLKEEVYILREPGSGTREIMEEELARKGIIVRKSMELGSTEAIKQAVAANLGVSIVSKYAITLEVVMGRLCAAHIKDLNLRRQLYTVFHRDRTLPLAAAAFLELIRESRAEFSQEDDGASRRGRKSE